MPDNGRLTYEEIKDAEALIADPLYRPNHVYEAVADAAARKMAWWLVTKLYQDDELPCGKRLYSIVSGLDIKPWPPSEEGPEEE